MGAIAVEQVEVLIEIDTDGVYRCLCVACYVLFEHLWVNNCQCVDECCGAQ